MSLNRADILDLASDIEDLLEKKLGATGKGLHEKATSVESRLDSSIMKKIRRVASIRNAAAHEKGFSLSSDKEESFIRNVDEIKTAINNIGKTNDNSNPNPNPNTNTNSNYDISNNSSNDSNNITIKNNNSSDILDFLVGFYSIFVIGVLVVNFYNNGLTYVLFSLLDLDFLDVFEDDFDLLTIIILFLVEIFIGSIIFENLEKEYKNNHSFIGCIGVITLIDILISPKLTLGVFSIFFIHHFYDLFQESNIKIKNNKSEAENANGFYIFLLIVVICVSFYNGVNNVVNSIISLWNSGLLTKILFLHFFIFQFGNFWRFAKLTKNASYFISGILTLIALLISPKTVVVFFIPIYMKLEVEIIFIEDKEQEKPKEELNDLSKNNKKTNNDTSEKEDNNKQETNNKEEVESNNIPETKVENKTEKTDSEKINNEYIEIDDIVDYLIDKKSYLNKRICIKIENKFRINLEFRNAGLFIENSEFTLDFCDFNNKEFKDLYIYLRDNYDSFSTIKDLNLYCYVSENKYNQNILKVEKVSYKGRTFESGSVLNIEVLFFRQ